MPPDTNKAGKFNGRPLVPLIVVEDADCGPAMAALPPAQRAFVIGKVRHGLNNAEAAKRAGYADGPNGGGAKVTGYRLAHTEAIIAAIIEESKKVLKSEGPNSIRTLVEIRDNRKNEAKDRLKAAVELLNRGGLNAVNEHHHLVEHRLTEEQQDKKILALARELGLPDAEARKMLISPDAIEGEFEEVTPEPERTPEQIDRAERYERNNEREQRQLRKAMTPEELAAHKERKRAEQKAAAKRKYEEAQVVKSSEGIEDLLR